MKKIIRLFHTVKYLKLIQIWRRLIKKILPSHFISTIKFIEVEKVINRFEPTVLSKQSIFGLWTFSFLNKKYNIKNFEYHNTNKIEKLWMYNLHYFDDLNSINSDQRRDWHNILIQKWIEQNPPVFGIGWEPYPTSLRIVNWIKWSLLGADMKKDWLNSLATQAKYLSKNLEYHLLGNHLFTNAKALIYAGLYFKGASAKNWYQIGIEIFNKELNEQLLPDGGHFELSPMYHSLFLEDLLDIINIHQAFNIKLPAQIINKILLMIKWLNTMCHPDGEISFFNDSAKSIAPTLKEITAYSYRLNINYKPSKFNNLTHLPDSGYIRLINKDAVVLIDVAKIGPDYLPGHAHADTLSFELSLYGKRLLVNSGISRYGTSLIRQFERSTVAHNTVAIDNKNSSEVWSGFRVARRAYPLDLKIEELENFVNISCAHDGYKRLDGNPIHRRHWQFLKNSLIIRDHVDGFFTNAYAYFHFHPSVTITKNKNSFWKIEMPNRQQVVLDVKMGEATIKESYYSPEFGKKLSSQCLKISLDKREGGCVEILWEN